MATMIEINKNENENKGYLLYLVNTDFVETLNLNPIPPEHASSEKELIKQVSVNRKFHLKIATNPTILQIAGLVSTFQQTEKLKKYSSFFIVVSTRGGNSDLLYARDGPYSIDELFGFFKSPSWVGKPKALLIAASRGSYGLLETPEPLQIHDLLQYPKSCNIFQYKQDYETDISQYIDIIVIFAASAGTIAFDDPPGNMYLKAFFKALLAKPGKVNILELLTEVQMKVTATRRKYEVMQSFNTLEGIEYSQVVYKDAIQVPCYYSSLRKPWLL